MSPEQATGKSVDQRADVYALGTILYHLLAGKPPYQGNSAQILVQLSERLPPPLESIQPELPPALLSRYDRQVLKSGFRVIHRLIELTSDYAWLDAL